MPLAMTTHCTGCGKVSTECPGCGRALDPPRFCPACGQRMTVRVIPTGWVARCRTPGRAVGWPATDPDDGKPRYELDEICITRFLHHWLSNKRARFPLIRRLVAPFAKPVGTARSRITDAASRIVLTPYGYHA